MKDLTQKKFDAMYKKHQKWLKNNNSSAKMVIVDYAIPELIMDGLDLSGAEFYRCGLPSIQDMNLSGAVFDECSFQYATIYNTVFKDTLFKKVSFYGAHFLHVDLSTVDFYECEFSQAESQEYHFYSIGGLGSTKRSTLYIPEIDKVFCGCFISNLDGFIKEIETEYPQEVYPNHLGYSHAIQFFTDISKEYSKNKKDGGA